MIIILLWHSPSLHLAPCWTHCSPCSLSELQGRERARKTRCEHPCSNNVYLYLTLFFAPSGPGSGCWCAEACAWCYRLRCHVQAGGRRHEPIECCSTPGGRQRLVALLFCSKSKDCLVSFVLTNSLKGRQTRLTGIGSRPNVSRQSH